MGINGTLQVAGFALSTIALLLAVIACADKQWRVSDYSQNVIESTRHFSGLWKKCFQQSIGFESCDTYDNNFLGLPDLLLAGRIFTCFGILFLVVGRLIGTMGLRIIKTSSAESTKAKMTVAAGFVNIVGGICVGVAATWFGARIAQTYYNPITAMNFNTGNNRFGAGAGVADEYQSNQRFILGRSLFFAWGSMFFGVGGGVLMVCSSWGAQSEDDDEFESGMPYANKNDYVVGNQGGAPGYV